MTYDDELIERVAIANFSDGTAPVEAWRRFAEVQPFVASLIINRARRTVDIVRAYDAERRASVLDVDALKSFAPTNPGTLVWLPDGMPSIPTHDPDDYRDLPVAMTRSVAFPGGLTTEKRK